MAFTKITENDTINKGVIGLPDTPNLSTSEMQAKFEELSNDVIIPKFNNLVDELEAKSAAGNIGATIPSGINAESENVQAVLNGIAEKAHTHEKSDAELTDAVTKAHEHSNKSVIDKFTENESGVPLYNGGKMTGDAFKTVKVGTTSIVATDYDTIEIIAGDNVVIDADEVNKTLKFSAVGGSGSGGGDMYKAVYDKNNDGMVDDAKTVGSLDLLNTTNKTNAVTAINEVLQDHTEFVDHGSLYSTNTETFKDLESGFYRLRNYKSDLFPGSVAVTGTMQKNVVGGHHTGTIITTDGVNYTRFADYDSSGTLVSDTGWKKMSVDTLTTMEQVEASTDDSKAVGAGAVKELSSSLMRHTLIWTNPDISASAFAGQTITVDVSPYDAIYIDMLSTDSIQRVVPNQIIGKGGTVYITYGTQGSNGVPWITTRNVQVSDNSIVFSDCTQQQTNGSNYTTVNYRIVPHKIYGIKF